MREAPGAVATGAPDVVVDAYLGSGISRREDERLLTGTGGFLDDLDFGECLEAVVLRAGHASARIRSLGLDAARAIPGVVGVFGPNELTSVLGEIPPKSAHPDLAYVVRRALASDVAHYYGEPLAMVVADTRRHGEDALAAIEVDYDVRRAVSTIAEAAATDGPRVHPELDSNVALRLVQRCGDPDGVLASSPHVLRQTFVVRRGGGHSLEGRAVAARFDAAAGQLIVWSATQAPHYVRNMLARLYAMSEEEIRVIAPRDIGGGFGPKAQFYGEEALVPWLAMQLRRPVKWIEDRTENFLSATTERTQIHHVDVAFDDEGRFLAVKDVFEHDIGAYCVGMQVPIITLTTIPGPYKIANLHLELTSYYTNLAPTAPLRGSGRPQAVFVMERIVERVAEHLGTTPEAVRTKNLIATDEFPFEVGLRTRDGSPLTYDSGNYPALHAEALRRIDVEAFRVHQIHERGHGRYLGLGCALFVEGSGLGPYEGARVRLTNTGRILVSLAASPQGQGYETVYAQLAADALGLPIDLVEIRHGDTAFIPAGQGTFASRVTSTAGPALWNACELLREDLLQAGAILLGVGRSEVRLGGGRIESHSGGMPRSIGLDELAATAVVGRHGSFVAAELPVAIERTAYFKPARPAYSSGVCATIVEVDTETGTVEVVRSVLGHDCGVVLNPRLVEGQLYGGYAHGLGNALYEEMRFDGGGRPLTTSYLEYALPSALEINRPELFHVTTPSPLNPLGVKGAGEGGVIPVPAAVANAVEDALRPFGARINESPVTAERVLRAIAAAANRPLEGAAPGG